MMKYLLDYFLNLKICESRFLSFKEFFFCVVTRSVVSVVTNDCCRTSHLSAQNPFVFAGCFYFGNVDFYPFLRCFCARVLNCRSFLNLFVFFPKLCLYTNDSFVIYSTFFLSLNLNAEINHLWLICEMS